MGRKKPTKASQISFDEEGVLSKQHKRQIQYMKDQYDSGDNEDAEETMAESFIARNAFIYWKRPKIVELQNTYPYLFQKKHFIAEFARMDKKAKWETYESNLRKFCDTILNFTVPTHPVHHLIEVALNKELSSDRKTYIKCVGALIGLTDTVKRSITSIIEFESEVPKTVYPEIVCRSSMKSLFLEKPQLSIFVEGQKIFETDSFVEAVFLRIAAHYCFFIEYSNNFVPCAAVIESLLLNFETDEATADQLKNLHCLDVVRERAKLFKLWKQHKFNPIKSE